MEAAKPAALAGWLPTIGAETPGSWVSATI